MEKRYVATARGSHIRYVPSRAWHVIAWYMLAALFLTGLVQAQHEPSEPRGLKAIVARQVLEKAARLLRSNAVGEVCDKLAGYGGTTVATVVRQHRLVIADVFDKLVTWDRVTQQIIKDQLTGALHMAGLAHSTASSVAFYIAEALGWIVL